jgi:hypothetical protein
MEMSLQPAKCTMWCVISKQGITGAIFGECTITNQEYLQQLQNEVIQGGRHVDTFFQQDGACPLTAYISLGVLHVFDSHVLWNLISRVL